MPDEPEYYMIRNWEKFQHYSKRNPPWIKLYNTILDDYQFNSLSDHSKLVLMLLWVFASRVGNKIPHDRSFLRTHLGIKKTGLQLSELIENKYLVPYDASIMLASCKQSARPETETETETEQRERQRKKPPISPFEKKPAPKKKRERKPHPALEKKKELQELSDHHAKLFGRQSIPIQLNSHTRRIVKVLEKYGMDTCKDIQIGHHANNGKPQFSSWQFAYPMIRDGPSKKSTEPDWEWIEQYRVAGEKKRSGFDGNRRPGR